MGSRAPPPTTARKRSSSTPTRPRHTRCSRRRSPRRSPHDLPRPPHDLPRPPHGLPTTSPRSPTTSPRPPHDLPVSSGAREGAHQDGRLPRRVREAVHRQQDRRGRGLCRPAEDAQGQGRQAQEDRRAACEASQGALRRARPRGGLGGARGGRHRQVRRGVARGGGRPNPSPQPSPRPQPQPEPLRPRYGEGSLEAVAKWKAENTVSLKARMGELGASEANMESVFESL